MKFIDNKPSFVPTVIGIMLLIPLLSCSPTPSGAREILDPQFSAQSIPARKTLIAVNGLSVAKVTLAAGVEGITSQEATQALKDSFRAGTEMEVIEGGSFPYFIHAEVNSYTERVGSAAGVLAPAKVGMTVAVKEKRSGRSIWEGSFSEEDKDLVANLLEADNRTHGGTRVGYSSGRSLLKRGFDAAALSFNEARFKAFRR